MVKFWISRGERQAKVSSQPLSSEEQTLTCQGYAQKKPWGYNLGERRDPGERFYFQGPSPPSSRKVTFLRESLEGLVMALIGSRSSGYVLGTIDGIVLPIPNDGPIPSVSSHKSPLI